MLTCKGLAHVLESMALMGDPPGSPATVVIHCVSGINRSPVSGC